MKHITLRACSEADALLRLKVAVDRIGSVRAFAEEMGITHSYVANVLRGKNPMSARLAAAIDLEPVTLYKIKGSAR